ncbi:MAG: transcription-repair coupling factor [Dehalococcoidia bacterium]|nr:transcription-repair coupling factor [Dehalococcoidia bacterium]
MNLKGLVGSRLALLVCARMNLSGLLPLLQSMPADQSLQGFDQQEVTVFDAVRPLVMATLHHDVNIPTLVITPNAEEAKRLYDELVAWCHPGARVLLFPETDVLPYEHLTPDSAIIQQRLRVLSILKDPGGTSPFIIASARAVLLKTLHAAAFAIQVVKTGNRMDLNRLLSRLVSIGYEAGEIVETPGTISKRGGIIDVYSPNNDYPARIEFLGSDVESIRWFDPVTQRSMRFVESLAIVPAREMIGPSKESVQKAFDSVDLSNCNVQTREAIGADMELLLQGQWRDGLEFYLPLFDADTLMDYFPADALVITDDPDNIAAELADLESQADQLRQGQVERGELPRNFPLPYFLRADLEEKRARIGRSISFRRWGDQRENALFNFGAAISYGGNISRFLDDASRGLKEGRRIVVISQQASRLAELFSEHGILTSPVEQIDNLPPPGLLMLVHGSLSSGGWTSGETSLFTDMELFGYVKERRSSPKRRSQHQIFLSDLAVGDYVVHIDHGIARFNGTTILKTEGVEREYLVLEYAEGDKLYVPTDQVDRVARYVGSGGYLPALSRLNTQEWDRSKERVKGATREMAGELLAIYAAREVSEGIAFEPDTPWERQLEASFPYVETPDQARTIAEVKQDMESAKPMDRLVCGDVGYGKTEIAVRAAFKAVASGMQVAVLVPTTVLAQQHYTTFTHRLAAFPIRIEVLSRFRSPREQQKVVEDLASGSVDICIGTHRLLQSDVIFNNLGLVVIDEEQKFGVAHKEKLKKLRSEVDVLTLTATPIPRTLHMAMVGARDMSAIETAPEARLPVKTYVGEWDSEMVREAILRELDRKGQVFFVHNRVESIGFVAEQLRELVPEARIVVGHGQMPEEVLESVMLDFTSGKYNVLACTTIIESGLDVPNANTLIINHADKLGLTQLYHLRGRVGRSDVRAYAYLLYDKDKRLTDLAQKRLKTIFEATELGAGYRIAMRDLEIRGAGNILGSEQSGNVGAVGFDLYCRLLADAVAELKAGVGAVIQRPELPTVDIPLTAHIPETYVPDLSGRLAIYHRLAKLESLEQVKDLQQELKDRFGQVPQPVQNLLLGIRLRLLGAQAGIQRIFTEGSQVVVAIGSESTISRASLQRSFGSSVKVGPNQIRLDIKQMGNFWTRILEQVLRTMIPKK